MSKCVSRLVASVSNCTLGYAVALRYDDFGLWVALRNGLIGWLTFIGAIGRDLTYFVFDLVEQWPKAMVNKWGQDDGPSARQRSFAKPR